MIVIIFICFETIEKDFNFTKVNSMKDGYIMICLNVIVVLY